MFPCAWAPHDAICLGFKVINSTLKWAPVLYHLSGSRVWDTMQFSAVHCHQLWALIDYKGFKLPLHQRTSYIRDCKDTSDKSDTSQLALWSCTRHWAFLGTLVLDSTTVWAENACPVYSFSSYVGLFLPGDTPTAVLCMKGISHLILSSLSNLQAGDLDPCPFPILYEGTYWRADEDPAIQLKPQLQ